MGELTFQSEASGKMTMLRDFLLTLTVPNDALNAEESYTIDDVEKWYSEVIDDLTPLDEEDAIADVAREYRVFDMIQGAGARNYRLNVHIDVGFGDSIEQIRNYVQLMLTSMSENQVQRFISRGLDRNGLTKRRKSSSTFPCPLPYFPNTPQTLKDKLKEEATLVEAAIHCALAKRTPTSHGSTLYINSYSKEKPHGKKWTLGSAFTHLYSNKGFLRLRLNKLALPHFNENIWAATIAHEILHNLGWGHGDGDYRKTNAIEIYEFCIRQSDPLTEEEMPFR